MFFKSSRLGWEELYFLYPVSSYLDDGGGDLELGKAER